MRKLKKLLLVFFIFISTRALADEGMWLPLFLQQLNEKEMKSLGMKISAADIYNINNGSLKDAIVSLGGFCTAEVISSKGLLLTNHHCGFDVIQNHSTLQNNYIRDGFWAKKAGDELSNPGLFATFIIRIEDVTAAILSGITPGLSEPERQSRIDKNLTGLRKNVSRESYQDILIRPFFEGNQYFLFVTETYRDIRLVGAPPSSIGNFGKDTDNWMWPRHTGDFSMFRIYADKNNKPANYSPDNVPYTPKRSLSISLDGTAANDFTMVFGFPGRTNEYIPAVAVQQILKVNDPAKISIREKILGVMDNYMRKDEQIKIQYAAKYASVQNSYKKWQGEVLGLTKTDGVGKKKKYEEEFMKRVNANSEWKAQYGNLLSELEKTYAEFETYGLRRDYFNEIIPRIELFGIFSSRLNELSNILDKNGEPGYSKAYPDIKEKISDAYKEYSAAVDKKLFEIMIEKFVKDQEPQFVAPELLELVKEFKNDYAKLAEAVYAATDLDDAKATMDKLEKNPKALLAEHQNDKANELFSALIDHNYNNVTKKLSELQTKINRLQREYMKAQMEVFKEKKFYPDANSTMRITYGQVKGYKSGEGKTYDYYTYLDGVMAKYKPGDYEFDVPAKLQELYKNKDYGQYGVNGKMPVCFIASNHTTGGNSGSPALDAYGNLVGLNFDRVWEGTMSDINYDPSICRNIMVDIRYVLFIIDKYAGASHLISEMNLVHPKN